MSPRRHRRIADLLSLLLTLALSAYLLVPGLGLDLLKLEKRFGWSVPTPWSEPAKPVGNDLAQAVESLRVRGGKYESTHPYHRDVFGQAWADEDHNGCDTRNDILARDLKEVTYKNPARPCKVMSGTLAEPYTGQIMHFQRGPKTSPLVQIDHVVALGDAWRSGAETWDLARRQKFANDPLNLLATEGQANEDKGSLSADQWLPPETNYHCAYVARQVAVKSKWNLSVTKPELNTFRKVLRGCPGQHLPQDLNQVHP
ncbi:hypothetical protein BSR28_02055 [Boudabousia liubingyangii]|uniref:HNH endonuclease family protein n=1 Tax=Boudabousia liubingyangii TaxID=1921764 RepID=UPI00093DF9D2|nr:HNH endonuclease family protein [Boudabousia liubingyangii]OKL48498.1 hypothetical protein BSR28_02055 [Boudabousia liubingyangii]